MKNAIHISIFFMMLTGAACFPSLTNAATSCEDAYFSADDFNHERPSRHPSPEFMKSYMLAKAGNAVEQRNVAVSYEEGYLVTACPEKAHYWYHKAARNGDQIAKDWIARYDMFKAMFDGPEFVGQNRPRIALNESNTESNDSPVNGPDDLAPIIEPYVPQTHSMDKLAGRVREAEAANNKKIAEVGMKRKQVEKAQPVGRQSTLHDAGNASARTQDVKRDSIAAQDPMPPAPYADPPAVSAGEAAGHSAMPPKEGNHESGYNGNTVAASTNAGGMLDINLERAINIAKETSFRLGRSKRNIDGALARYQAASSLYRPRFDSSVFATQASHEIPGTEPGLLPQFSASLNFGVTQPLDIGGIIGHQVTQTELSLRSAEYDLAQSHLDVSLEVATNYYNALRAQEVVRVDKQDVEDLERLVAETREIPGNIKDFIQVELANARQTLTSSRTILDLSFDTLKQSLRLAPGTAVRLTDSFSHDGFAMDGVQALREALARRPDIGQISVRIEQTQLASDQVSDVRKPTLNLQLYSNNAYYSRIPGSAFSNPLNYDRGVMMTLNMPLAYFDWGYLSETKRAALMQNEQAKFDLQEARERVGLEVRQAVIALKRAEQRVRTLPDLKLAHDSLSRAESDILAAGKKADPATLAQMSNARASRRLAETVTIDALYEYNIAIFNLKHVIGTSPQAAELSAGKKSAASMEK